MQDSVSTVPNTLPVSMRTVLSYLTFRRELQTFLFNISFPDNWTVRVTLWSGPAVIDSDTVILASYYYYYYCMFTGVHMLDVVDFNSLDVSLDQM